MSRRARPLSERLWMLVDRRGLDDCWPWLGSLGSSGYGRISTGGRGGRQIGAHVAAWQVSNSHGSVPSGLDVRHTCDNRICCNPVHLIVGTRSENMQDAVRRGRIAREFRIPNTKLSDEDVRHIRANYLRPSHNVSNAKELASRFGVTVQHIQLIVNGRKRRAAA